MENTHGTPSPANTLHWGHRAHQDHILLDSLLAAMISVPVTMAGPLTDAAVRRLEDAVEARSTPGARYWLDEVSTAPRSGFGGVGGATHIAWVVAFPY